MTTRAEIIEITRSWIETPVLHQQRSKGVGVDCGGLLIGVSREAGLVAPEFDVGGYALTPDGTSLLEVCDRHMQRVAEVNMRAGDAIVVAWTRDQSRRPHHLGILVPYRHGGLAMVHASARDGRVVEHRLVLGPLMQFVAAYRLPGVVD